MIRTFGDCVNLRLLGLSSATFNLVNYEVIFYGLKNSDNITVYVKGKIVQTWILILTGNQRLSSWNKLNVVVIGVNGTPIYFNPNNGLECIDYVPASSLNDSKSGCMKWYMFNDTSNNTFNMILDHNTTYGVAWNSSGYSDNGPIEILHRIQSDTSGWHSNLIRNDLYYNQIYTISNT